MSNLIKIELNRVCRTCLSSTKNMKSLFESCSVGIETCIAEMLMTYTLLKCYENDGLPTQICDNCLTILNLFHAFKVKCLETNVTLRNYVKNVAKTGEKTDFEEVLVKNIDLKPKNVLNRSPDPLEISQNIPVPDLIWIKNKNVPLKTPLKMIDIQNDLDQKIDIIKHEIESTNSIFGETNVKDDKYSGEKLYSCTYCDCSYSEKPLFMKHMETHLEEKPYSCTESNNSTAHSGETPYSCTACNRTFSRKCNLTEHIATHLGEKPYSCTVLEHNGEKLYSCTVCGKQFDKKGYLTVHMRVHREKPYSCTICDNSYNRKSHLTVHMRVHREKPYPCTVCDRAYTYKKTLRAHMRNHSGENLYSCTICKILCINQSSLNVHMRSHTGEKPYSCTICSKSFTKKSGWKNHIATHIRKK